MVRTDLLWQDYSNQLLGFIQRRVNDSAVAEDILQDVFLKMFERLDSLRDADKLQSWMYQIARHAIVDYYRSKKPADVVLEELPDGSGDDEGDAREEMIGWLRPLIGMLPDTYHEAVWFSEVDGLTHQVVAERLGISLTATKSRVRRGKQMMKEMLTDCCRFEFDQRGRVVDYEQRGEDCLMC